jgi:NADPH:quinone reductase
VHAENLEALFTLFKEGKIRPHITELHGLECFGEALELLNGRRSTGKVVIRVAQGEA